MNEENIIKLKNTLESFDIGQFDETYKSFNEEYRLYQANVIMLFLSLTPVEQLIIEKTMVDLKVNRTW